ncbi:hypothetical protein [Algirhabdus cladophorae]|uniref:hypothetical protein n=1 Tax=Algirhabdus cladophorae TaxID=3377108 RepID=UPI003B847346
MTEITVKNLWLRILPDHRKPERLIDPVAFTAAFVLAPFIFAAAFFWVLLIPVVGVVLGAPAYILVAMPMLWMRMRRDEITKPQAMAVGIAAHVLSTLFAVVVLALIPDFAPRNFAENAIGYFFLGLFHAPAWCALFASLYIRWERDFYKQFV